MNTDKSTIDAELESLQLDTFGYFLLWTNLQNGLVLDKTAPDWPASIAATGLALAAYPIAVDRGFITRAAAIEIILATLRFFWSSPQGPEMASRVTTAWLPSSSHATSSCRWAHPKTAPMCKACARWAI